MSKSKLKAPCHCANCGKPGHRVVEVIYNPHEFGLTSRVKPTDSDVLTWKYAGNGVVLKTDINNVPDQLKYIIKVSVWDGESWALNRDPFCTVQCAERFARRAYAAGFRK